MSKAILRPRTFPAALIGLVMLAWIGGSEAIIIRHDVNARNHEVRSAEFPAVFYLEQRGGDRVCAATVIHARWAITAAHCVHETSLSRTLASGGSFSVRVGGKDREIDAVEIHPDYDIDSTQSTDLALLRFTDASSAPVIPLQTDPTELGQVATLVGWGFFGWGTTGREFSDGRIRMATNRITTAAERLETRFDDPRPPDSDALPMEGTPGLWDSGGPALLGERGAYRLAGVAVGELEGEHLSEETQGRYGAIAVYERISSHLDWIESVIGIEGRIKKSTFSISYASQGKSNQHESTICIFGIGMIGYTEIASSGTWKPSVFATMHCCASRVANARLSSWEAM